MYRCYWHYEEILQETALIHLTQKYDMSFRDERKDSKRISEIPFDSVRKLMTVLYETKNGKHIIFTKGAFDSLVTRFKYYLDENGNVQNVNEEFIKKDWKSLTTN